jgi:hypothetical protein
MGETRGLSLILDLPACELTCVMGKSLGHKHLLMSRQAVTKHVTSVMYVLRERAQLIIKRFWWHCRHFSNYQIIVIRYQKVLKAGMK